MTSFSFKNNENSRIKPNFLAESTSLNSYVGPVVNCTLPSTSIPIQINMIHSINVRSIIYIFIYIIDPTFISSTKYRSHAIKEPFRHRPAIIALQYEKEGSTKNYGFYYHCVILETRVYILL